jgi:hypothetical protein
MPAASPGAGAAAGALLEPLRIAAQYDALGREATKGVHAARRWVY